MPLYISVSPDNLARRSRFLKSQFLIDCRTSDKFPVLGLKRDEVAL
jgi:hypothetical protein